MARRHEEIHLLEAWRALPQCDNNDTGWRCIPVISSQGHLFQAGRHFPDNLESILVGFQMEIPPRSQNLPEGKGFSVVFVGQLPGLSGFWVGLHRQPTGNLELFAKMAVDVLNVIDNRSSHDKVAFDIFLHRIRAWQKFMEQDRRGVLSSEEMIGLCGELEILQDLLDAGLSAGAALAAWRGPLGSLHDFHFETGALEVKSTASRRNNIIQISSAEQLDTTQVAPLYLATCRFAADSSGVSLADRMRRMRQALGSNQDAVSLFESLLLHLGIESIATFESADPLLLLEKRLFPISADFPKLTASTLPAAICDVRYSLDITLIDHQQTNLLQMLLDMGVLLHGAS